MKQILHIFVKDTRRFWPEIIVSLAITAAFTWAYPSWWIPDQVGQGYEMKYLAAILLPLVYVGWCVLIARVVHGEMLVGDCQFWLTRPYEWKKLLAAKLLFLLAFLYLPTFIAQQVLLAEAGFTPSAYVPGLLFSLLLLTDMIVVIFALSAVTSSFASLALTLLGVLLGYIGFRFLSLVHPGSHVASVASPFGDTTSFVLMLCGCGAAVVLQYGLRKTSLARLVLIAIPVLLVITGAIAGVIARNQTAMDRTYPPRTGEAAVPALLSYHPSSSGSTHGTYPDTGEAIIYIPLKGSGVSQGYVATPEAAKVVIEAPDGSHWSSVWQAIDKPQGIQPSRYLPADEYNDGPFLLPRALYDKWKETPVTVHLTLALSVAQAGRVTRISLPAHELSVPDFGICTPSTNPTMPSVPSVAVFFCRSALREPQLTHIDVVWSDTPCFAPHAEPDPGVQGAAWVGSLDREPAPGITFVWTTKGPITFSNQFKPEGMNHSRYLCPGSPVTFTNYNLVRRTQETVTIQGFLLGGIAAGRVHEWRTTNP